MIVTKKTISKDDTINFNKALNIVKEFSDADFGNIDAVFIFKIAGRKTLEFYILYTCGEGNEVVVDLTNRTIQKLSEFKWGTAQTFSKTLVKNWDKLSYEEDGSFKI